MEEGKGGWGRRTRQTDRYIDTQTYEGDRERDTVIEREGGREGGRERGGRGRGRGR